jgi:long-chain acyl-CoA synthetase
MSTNLASLLTDAAQKYGDRPAVRLDDTTLTYAQLDGASAHVAGLLRAKGINPGDRVGIMLPNVPYFPVAYFGILRYGCTVVPMNVLLKGRETTFYLQDPEAKAVFAWHEFLDSARIGAEAAGAQVIEVKPGEFEQMNGKAEPLTGVAEVDAQDTAVILYTSGTTGSPKGAQLTHASLRENAVVTTETLIENTDTDVILGALPLFHVFGMTCSMNSGVYTGSLLSQIPRFDPAKALEIIQRDQVTVFMGVPTMFSAMLHVKDRESYDTSSLRVCISGGSAMPVEVMRGFEEAFHCKVLEGYGLSETSPVASFNHPDRERKPGSIGTPIRGVEMKVGDDDGNEVPQGEVGQIWIKGHNVMKGYWKRDDATAEVMRDGWFATGDMAKVDEDGYFFIVDRKKDMIIRGGYNVYPREIEEVLYEHPAVREVAVLGVPHDSLGEEVAAAVALKDGAEATPDELRAFVKEQVANYKYPRHVWIIDELPKGPTGKILKREVKVPDDL